MTVKELASKMNELMRDGYSNLPVYFCDGPISYPILDISKQPMLIGPENKVIGLTWKEDMFKILVTKPDLENSLRATFNPDEKQKDQ